MVLLDHRDHRDLKDQQVLEFQRDMLNKHFALMKELK
jgi:hypothetical protein